MSYGKVQDGFWESERIDGLSDCATLLALFLMTGPHRNAIGCFRLGVGAISDVERFKKWGMDEIRSYLNELSASGFLIWDENKGWMLICKALEKDPIKSATSAVHALGLAARVPRKSIVYEELKARLEPQLMPHAKALEGKDGWPLEEAFIPLAIGDAMPQPSPLPLPSPSPEPFRLSADADSRANKPRAHVEQAVDAWNAFADQHGLSKVQRLTDKRIKACNARLKECGGIEGWKVALERVAESPFLLGIEKNWRCDFDFLCQAKSFTKLMEGAYAPSNRCGPALGRGDAHTAQSAAFANVAAGLGPRESHEGRSDGASGGRDPARGSALGGAGSLAAADRAGVDPRQDRDPAGPLGGAEGHAGAVGGDGTGLAGGAGRPSGGGDPDRLPDLAAGAVMEADAGGHPAAGQPGDRGRDGRAAATDQAAGAAGGLAVASDGLPDIPHFLDRRGTKTKGGGR